MNQNHYVAGYIAHSRPCTSSLVFMAPFIATAKDVHPEGVQTCWRC